MGYPLWIGYGLSVLLAILLPFRLNAIPHSNSSMYLESELDAAFEADLDGDRLPDPVLISADRSSAVITLSRVQRQTQLSFSIPVSSLLAFDLDRDGDADLVALPRTSPIHLWPKDARANLWINNGRGSFILRKVLASLSLCARYDKNTETQPEIPPARWASSAGFPPKCPAALFFPKDPRMVLLGRTPNCSSRAPPVQSAQL